MKSFKISHHKQKDRFRWLNWLAISFGFIHLYWAVGAYPYSTGSHNAIVELLMGLFWIVFGYVNLFWIEPPLPDITIDADGITVEEKTTSRLLQWNTIRNINIDTNTIYVHLETGTEEQIKIWTVKYSELQLLKQRLQEYSTDHQISYSSKY